MMKKLNILFIAIGIGFFVKMMLEYDLTAIGNDLSSVGFGFLYVLAIWILFLIADTVTWKHTFCELKGRVGYLELAMIMSAGQSINNVAPSGNLGELIKAKYLAEHIGNSGSVSSVIIFNFLHLAGSVILILIGALFSLFLPQVPRGISLLLLLCSMALVGWVFLFLYILKKGLTYKLVSWAKKLRIPLKKPERWLESAKQVDTKIREFRSKYPRDFWITVVAQFVSRASAVLEVYVICWLLQKPVSLPMAFFIMSASQLLFWMFSMIPSQIGVMEQSSDALFGAMEYKPGLGFTFELVRRARRVVQITFGLVVLLFLSVRAARPKKELLIPGQQAPERP
jgi:uncharacterized protein (TIRG00374 family)